MFSVTQSCPTLCDLMDCSLPGSSVHGIFQENTGVGCHFLPQGIFLTQGSNLQNMKMCLQHRTSQNIKMCLPRSEGLDLQRSEQR